MASEDRYWQVIENMQTAIDGVVAERDSLLRSGQNIAQIEAIGKSLYHSSPFYVDPSICKILPSLARSLPDTAVLSAEDLPADFGFAELGEPIKEASEFFDAHIMALGWSCVGDSVSFCTYLSGKVGEAFTVDERFTDKTVFTYPFSSVINTTYSGKLNHTILEMDMKTNTDRDESNIDLEDKFKEMDKAHNRLVLTFLLFSSSRLVRHSRPQNRPNRALRRRIPNIEDFEEHLKIIELRATDYLPSGSTHETEREYTCRWVVRPHWRRLKDRVVPVVGYIKGPPDKPLKTNASKIFAVMY